jgi:DNA invertase Pin-like site-specific DNA recombinase
MTSMISYLRVSTAQQGKSGLGLEAQRATITQFAAAEGLEITGEFVEVETGKAATRWHVAHSFAKRSS